MANITRAWKRAFFVGCSHGVHADPVAIEAVLKFRKAWKPHYSVHLGDFMDTAAFRSGAKGSTDESEPIAPDVDAGLRFLEQLECTHVLCGNHEQRVFDLRFSNSAIIAACADEVVRGIQQKCKRLKASLHEYTGVWQEVRLGPVRAMHGVFFGENAIRDHAESFGTVVHAHTHRAGVAKGRTSGNPTGWCTGTLTQVENMDYAARRRATLAWSQGFVWGEIADDKAVLWLHENPRGTEWRLPV